MLKKRRVILIASIVLLGIILSLNFLLKFDNGQNGFNKQVEQKLAEVISGFDEDYIKILMNNRPNVKVSFLALNTDTNYPFYLFSEEGDLVYWSDITMIPEFTDFGKNRKYQLIDNNKGIYFSKLRKLRRSNQNFWVVQVFPLFDKVEIQNDYLNAGYNPDIFGNERFILSSIPEENYSDIYYQNDYLFSVMFRVGYENAGQNSNRTLLVFFFSLLGLVILIGGDFVATIWNKGRRWLAILYTFLMLFSVRFLMILFHFPQDFFETELFSPSRYASSLMNPSLGDLLLNVICSLIVLVMVLVVLGRKRFLINFMQIRAKYKYWVFLVSAFLLSTLLMVLFFNLFSNIVQNSQWNLNILTIPTFDYFKAISLLIIFLGGAGYLLFSIIVLNMVLYRSAYSKAYVLKILLILSVPVIILLANKDMVFLIAFLAHFILLVAIISFQLYNNIFKLGLNTFLTFFFGCLVGAVIIGSAAYHNLRHEEIQSKQKFANFVLIEDDVMTEFLMAEVMVKIQRDTFILNSFIDPFLSKAPIEQKIKKIYLTSYFDQFSSEVKVFNKMGESMIDREKSRRLNEYRIKYMNSDYATAVRNLYHIKGSDAESTNKFVAFVNLYKYSNFLGTVLIEMARQRVQASSVFPKLLLDNKYALNFNEKNFDYAIFQENQLQFSTGVYNYRNPQVGNILQNENVFSKGIILDGYHHFAVRGQDETILISSPAYPNHYILADVALFFVTFLLLTLFSIFIYTLFLGLDRLRFNYTTKLQFYLNFAFFFPMLVISAIAVGFLSRSYTEDLHRQYFEKASIIRENLSKYLDAQVHNAIAKEEFMDEVHTLSRTTNTDINIYHPDGRLMATNQPTIFEKKILTEYLNPKAYSAIIETQNNRLLLNEEIGNLKYKTVYSALRDPENQAIQGIIAIPFFESEDDLNDLIADVFSNILNIFVFIFLIFLVISFFVSRNLTYPFRLLTQKLKTTNLENNEFMNWPAKDEIGLLVNEYNNMLFKLEASKKVLASNEKETAWREMAKQVAHEIKNPLTPMKLTLQHMLRLQGEGKLNEPKKLHKPLETLIHQVDTLSDIATSFSTFAKMPLPKNEIMDFRAVVIEAVELFKIREDVNICFLDHITSTEKVWIMGDDKLFGRVISNLIINGIQAVEEGQQAEISVILTLEGQQVKLKIQDNGKGIEKELMDKIFIPNFSTKSEGSGLGLAIAKRGVETAGGRIWFITKLGKGTSFYLSFPLVK